MGRVNLRKRSRFGTEHLSLYQLTIEPGTAFATLSRQGKLELPDEDMAADFYEVTQDLCEQAGLPAYEVSNHAKAGAESRHNLVYWRYGDYVGVGPGAHGRLTLDGRRVATEAERLPERWFAEVERAGHSFKARDIAPDEAAREQLLMGLRLSEGINLLSSQRWGHDAGRSLSSNALVAEADLLWSRRRTPGARPHRKAVSSSTESSPN